MKITYILIVINKNIIQLTNLSLLSEGICTIECYLKKALCEYVRCTADLDCRMFLWESFFLQDVQRYLKQVLNNTIICNLEDGCLWIFVYCYNHFTVFHACQVLDGSRDAHSNVQILLSNTIIVCILQIYFISNISNQTLSHFSDVHS